MPIQPTTMLFRPADEPNDQVWGLKVESAAFDDELVPDALKDGWFSHATEATEGVSGAEDAQPKRRGRPPKEG